ncbi:MAG: hypothetical protein ACYTG7_07245 [Planctomycetota bacterium]|jgi:hypothetical protein
MGNKVFLMVLLTSLLAYPVGALADEEKGYHDTSRPGEGQGPTQIRFFIGVLDIDKIEGADQSFSANFYVRLRWKDERLTHGGKSVRKSPLDTVWNPRIAVVNQGGIIRRTLPDVVEVTRDGIVTYHQRYVGSLSQPLKLSEFPRDRHDFTIQFVAAGYTEEELVFVPDVVQREGELTGCTLSDELSLSDWVIKKFQAMSHPFEPVAEVRTAGFAFEFEAERRFLYYFWQVIVPLLVVVAMSWAAFWIDPSQAGSQISVATSSILTLIAYRFVVAGLLPRLSYMTRIDYFTLGSTMLVFLALVEVILTSYLANRNRVELARTIDRFARFAFPTVFLLLFVGSFFV